jgi:3-oxoacyl-[acyl-carrier-protein] synthase-3
VKAYLGGVRYSTPAARRTNEDLVRLNPGWDSQAIYNKTGIRSRYIAGEGETASDLGVQAAEALIKDYNLDRSSVDALVFCSHSADYIMPATACILQTRLGLRESCAAFDLSLGCSGFVYALWIAHSLLLSESATNVLLITGDTYSKYSDPHDLATATLFGDASTAVLVTAERDRALATLGPFVLGSDGRGAEQLIVRAGGARQPLVGPMATPTCVQPQSREHDNYLFMNGPEIFAFALSKVPAVIGRLLEKAGLSWAEVDLFLLHQANKFMLEHLAKVMRVPSHKVPIDMETMGNTASATIPILLHRCESQGVLRPGHRCVLVGFGVGYSWAAAQLTWGAPDS